MSNTSIQDGHPKIREDLTNIHVDGGVRPYRIIIDEIGGRFARVSEHVWQQLMRADAGAGPWAEAHAAGWLRNRNRLPKRRFSPLLIRIRLGSIDWLAKTLSGYSGIFFSPFAMALWSSVIMLAAAAVVSRSDQWFASLGSLPGYLKQSNPLLIATLFVSTKLIHEVAHAVMCRRLGSRCGDAGVLLLCGMPCPYCDVTDIWRQPSSIKRVCVMMAGIYAELIIAALAALVWITSHAPSMQLAAMNVMLTCGISTLVFNANPLLRYDGYFVLADLLRSANLRHEARMAFDSVVTRRVAGRRYTARSKRNPRSLFLAGFHAASKLYRVVVACAIATLLVQYADWFGLRAAAITVVAVAALLAVGQIVRSLGQVMAGRDGWHGVPLPRRIVPVGLFVLLLALLVLVPLPRYRRAVGVIDVASARPVFVSEDGVVEEVLAGFGQVVEEGDTLVQFDRGLMMVREKNLEGNLRVAKIRRDLARRFALDDTNTSQPSAADQWQTLQAAEQAAQTQLESMRRRIAETDLRAPVHGVVIPASATNSRKESLSMTQLSKRVGMALTAGHTWCRVSESGQLHAALVVDARDRSCIQIGSTVMISTTQDPGNVIQSKVISVSAIHQVDSHGLNSAAYQVHCPLPAVGDGEIVPWVGLECRGVFRLPSRTLASAMTSWLENWFRG